ncbi:MAG: hypothetical protein KDB53_04220, partial [Planctomycetes bacterium]|nr:hypothetical protein [Planctomycetota bacterium]
MVDERWMALRFPDLSWERLLRDEEDAGRPLGLVWRDRGREILVMVDPVARARGLRPGMPLAAGRALSADLVVQPFDAVGDRQRLERLAGIFLRLGPDLGIDPFTEGRGLLVEVAKTAVHFGGEAGTVDEARRVAERLGHRLVWAVAARPAAASALAHPRLHEDVPRVVAQTDLAAALRRLPLAVLEPDGAIRRTAHLLGLDTVGDVARLPRAGLAGRLGEDFLRRLEELLGERETPLVR